MVSQGRKTVDCHLSQMVAGIQLRSKIMVNLLGLSEICSLILVFALPGIEISRRTVCRRGRRLPAGHQASPSQPDCTRLLCSEQAPGGNKGRRLTASTKDLGDRVEIRIRDNGTGIPPDV